MKLTNRLRNGIGSLLLALSIAPVTAFGASDGEVIEVTELYVAMFGRAPDGDGLQFWLRNFSSGELPTMRDVADSMFGSDPARTQFPRGLSNEEIVRRFYVNTLGRQPDPRGLAFWTSELDAANSDAEDIVGPLIKQMINAVRDFDPSKFDDPAVADQGRNSKALFENKITVAKYFVEQTAAMVPDAERALGAVTAGSDTSSTQAIETLLTAANALTPKSDDGGEVIAGSGSALECFNPDFFAPGTMSISTTRVTGGAGTGETTILDTQRTVMGTTTFIGENLTEIDLRIDIAVGDITIPSTSTEYAELDPSTPRFLEYGIRTETAAQGVTTVATTTFDPPISFRFDLDPGDSYTQNYDSITETDFGFGQPTTATTQKEDTWTYLGQESVTVPAGTFNACKFRKDEIVTGATGGTEQVSSELWFDVDTGLEVRLELDSGETSVLLSGSQNGQPLE